MSILSNPTELSKLWATGKEEAVKKMTVEKNRRILVIDDSEAIHEDYRAVLTDADAHPINVDEEETAIFGTALNSLKHGYFEIDSAFQGREGLDKVEQSLLEDRPYAMAFVDVRMPPGWDGVETVQRIWQRYPQLQVVICTAYSDYSRHDMIQKLGKSDQWLILKKPFDNVEVYQMACALTEKWVLSRKAELKQQELEGRVKERTAELAAANDLLRQEIIERKQAEEALQKTYALLKHSQSQLIQTAKMDVIGKLASGVAHEVKNPLGIITLGADYLAEKLISEDEDICLSIEEMKTAAIRADNIVKGLLDFSQISELELAPQSLSSLTEQVLLLVKHEFTKHRIEVVKEFQEDIPDAEIDKNKIEQLLVNLFLNAARAMSDGGRLKVRIYSRQITAVDQRINHGKSDTFKLGKSMVVTEIEDTGPGIPDDILDQIFDPFFTTSRNQGGTGLGLSIVSSIIDMHKGKLEIKNNKNGGVKVTVMLKA